MSCLTLISLIRHGNDFQEYMVETILPQGLKRIRRKAPWLNLITLDTADEAKNFGDEISIREPMEFPDADFHPTGEEGSKSVSLQGTKVSLKLDHHRYQQFGLNDREVLAHMSAGTLPDAMGGAFDSVARTVNKDAQSMSKEVPYFSGKLGSTNLRDTADLIEANRTMVEMGIDNEMSMVLTPSTMAQMQGEFADLSKYGDKDLITEGHLNRKMGFDIYGDPTGKAHVAGSAAGNAGLTLGSSASAGSKALLLTGVANTTFNKGDVLEVAGYPTGLVVTENVVGTETAVIPVYPALAVALPAGTAVTVAPTHPLDIAFTKSAFLMAFRPLETASVAPGVTTATATDPLTGLSLRVMHWYEPRTLNALWKVDILYGMKVISPERAIRFGGH